jgi:amyloid beta precursor protein binding protein 1
MYTLPIDPQTLALVQQYGRQRNLPLVSIHSTGFYSYFRIHLPGCFPIIDTHPDSTATTDLRLLNPWPALSDFAEKLTKDIDSLSAHDHGHIPYVVLLLYYLGKWKESHGGFPSTYGDKKAFREFLSAGARTDNPEGGEENYDEAAAAVLKTVSAPALSSSVKAVFDYQPSSVSIQSLQYEHTTYHFAYQEESNLNFWIIADAIKKFYQKYNQLPLPGSVPDMKAQSSVYVELQNIYKTKARQDVAEVLETVRLHPRGKEIDITEVETFCKNAAFVKLIHGPDSSSAALRDIAGMSLYPSFISTSNRAKPKSLKAMNRYH